ncbi:sigma-70 family RNA polymerase sigma factor [Halalkalibacter alkalisediminis]|uniref:Sigma-70 family RNA polymerase sigma factor n=1 Tax=Halalkalibacter alkalisediminis TaxID=935616 RepID=A0ABV6NLP9_9BACI|nr:sigma-70 family RNA polymerase sigma factor [Halalkalibacter alkalisediminis]
MNKKEKDILLEKLMVEYGNELFRLTFTYVKDKELAKDLVQNTFIKCYENLETFRNDSKIKTWLYRIAINECKDHFRSWQYKKVQVNNLLGVYKGLSVPSFENKIIQKSNALNIKEVVFSLPKKYSEIINLYYFSSLKIEEIADVTGLQVNTVKTRLRRAKQKLKNKVGEVEIYG